MTSKEIIEGNKLIAEFMGFVRHFPNMTSTSDLSQVYYYPYVDRIFDEGLYTSTIKMTSEQGYYHNQCIRESHNLKYMQFHKSWGWLMPVVEKIETIKVEGYKINFSIMNKTAHWTPAHWGGLRTYLAQSKIESCWLACVEFIKWHNQNK